MFWKMFGPALLAGFAASGCCIPSEEQRDNLLPVPSFGELGPDSPEELRAQASDLRLSGRVVEARELECRAQEISLGGVPQGGFTPARYGAGGAILPAGGFSSVYPSRPSGFQGAWRRPLVLDDPTLAESGITRIESTQPAGLRPTGLRPMSGWGTPVGGPGIERDKMLARLDAIQSEMDSISSDVAGLRTEQDQLRDDSENLRAAAADYFDKAGDDEETTGPNGGVVVPRNATPGATRGSNGAAGHLVNSEADARNAQGEAARAMNRADAIPQRITALQARLNRLTAERNALRTALGL